MIYRTVNFFAMGTILITMSLLGYVGYLMFYPFPTAECTQPYIVQNKQVKAGDMLRYSFDYCRFTDADVEIIHQVRGANDVRLNNVGVVFKVADAGLRLRPGCGSATKGIHLPQTLPPGVYYLEEQLSYFVNPFQTIHHEFRSEEFEVIE